MKNSDRKLIDLLFSFQARQMLTLRDLAEISGIPYATLTHWKDRMRAEDNGGDPVGLYWQSRRKICNFLKGRGPTWQNRVDAWMDGF